MTAPPRVQAPPGAQHIGMSPLRSPPAKADATPDHHPVYRGCPPRRTAELRVMVMSSRRPGCRARVGGRSSLALATNW